MFQNFGAWDSNGGNGAAYTGVFGNARIEKGGKMINLNDPAENDALATQCMVALAMVLPSEIVNVLPLVLGRRLIMVKPSLKA